MEKLFDLDEFDSYKEDNRREVKSAKNGLPNSIWETYSAFSNGYGGVIILGVIENKDGTWFTSGLDADSCQKLIKQFWNDINNRQKVSINLLRDDDVEVYKKEDDQIVVIHVPMARREEKPVYINNNLFHGTYRRNHDGDYHCTRLQVKTMLRDQAEKTMDMEVLDDVPLEDLNYETIQGYRNRHQVLNAGHPFERLNNDEYLRSIGAAAISKEDHQLHPTAAGMLMFGNEYNIVRHFPDYFLDYREVLDPSIRWTDRLQSSSGERSGSGVPNIFNTWEDQGWKEPVIEERFDPDRTILTLEFVDKTNKEKAAKKSGEEKTAKKKITNKTKEKMIKIKEYLSENKEAKTKDIAEYIGLKHSRTREIFSQMDSVESIGTNTNRKYRLKDNQK